MGVDFCKRGAHVLDLTLGKYCDINSSNDMTIRALQG